MWKRLSPQQLNLAIQFFSLVSIFFEGYDQGVMGGVNASPRYVTEVGIGTSDGTVTDTTHEGGIVSVYYLGAIFGCFAGGYLADRTGRINGMLMGAIFALVGGALQSAAQNSNFMICARVLTGIGTGGNFDWHHPVLVAETSSAEHRGGFMGYVFIANYLGISIAYWTSFGLAFINNGYSDIRWRLLLAIQCIPALFLVCFIKMLPESPRYLASVGSQVEAREILGRLRAHRSTEQQIDLEFSQIVTTAEESHNSVFQFAKILLGLGGKLYPNLGRRAWLCILLQVMASWTGITAVTAYSPVLLKQAGYSQLTQNGLAGGINTIGIIGTLISAQIVDRLGRRVCLISGAAWLLVVNLIAGSVYESSLRNPEKASQYAPGAVAMLFLFNLGYASTWGTVAFLVPTEIFPSDLRAQGNGFGITGWAIGVGMTTLVNPIMFESMKSLYPETRNRSLESIEALFSTSSPFNWKMEQAFNLQADVLVDGGISRDDGKPELEMIA
ncbi:Major facilitator superfamily domain general substrate transporter [Penicillium hetheringtonii]|uniref:Major facilitator superfamily domain general substrate transporter n=1 Tax=Penicillium hetheringtonii TaxID=911720 RepID=A0AAD6DEU4_9EURO|nr:Major facilitator superfamily domain general substrate transporter [Penicillium hetheringtonii]